MVKHSIILTRFVLGPRCSLIQSADILDQEAFQNAIEEDDGSNWLLKITVGLTWYAQAELSR